MVQDPRACNLDARTLICKGADGPDLDKFLFKEPLTPLMAGGITRILGGVLLLETGVTH